MQQRADFRDVLQGNIASFPQRLKNTLRKELFLPLAIGIVSRLFQRGENIHFIFYRHSAFLPIIFILSQHYTEIYVKMCDNFYIVICVICEL